MAYLSLALTVQKLSIVPQMDWVGMGQYYESLLELY